MDLQTVINFVSSTPTPPTPGGGGEGELVNAAQTGDALFFIVAMLLCVAAASFVMLRMWKAKKANAYVGAHVAGSSVSAGKGASKSPIALAIIGAIFAILLATTMVSTNSNSALAQNNDRTTNAGPIVPSKGEINAVVDEEVGTVSIEEFTVTNTDTDFFKFNAVSATKEDGIDDGDCNWTVYLSNEPNISEDDIIYNGQASGIAQALAHDRYIEGNGIAYVRMETDMEADVAKSLIGKKVLSLNLAYEDQDTVNTAFVAGENGEISFDGVTPVVPDAAKYFVNNEDNTILSVYDGCHWQDVVALPDTANNYVFQEWSANSEAITPGAEQTISATTIFSASFDLKNCTIIYDKNGGSTEAPVSKTVKYGSATPLASYVGTLSGEPATGWNTEADGNGFHYDFGTSFTVTEDTVTLFADWSAPTFKAVYNNDGTEVLFTYDKVAYDQSQYTTVEYKEADGTPTLSFEDETAWKLDSVRENFVTAKIDESMKSLPLVKISYMFQNMKDLTQIEGLGNLNWNSISDVLYMFANLTSLKEITLPNGVFANIELWGEGETAFCNNVLETITNEAPIICKGEAADFNRFWKSYRTWIDVDTGEAYPRFTPIPAGTFTVNKVSWSDTSKVASVKGYDNEYATYFEPVTLNSGDKIPSWVSRLEIKSTDEGATGYMAKVKATTPEGKDVVYYANYSPAYGAVSINLGNEDVCSSYDIDVEIYTPETTHTITANFEDANLTDEVIYNYFTTKGWTKASDSVYTKEFNHGITIGGVTDALPDSGITYKYNNPYTMDTEKVFQQWGIGTDDETGMVIPEDVTFYPQFDYIIQVLAVPCMMPDKIIGGLLLNASGEEMDLPGGIALAVPTGSNMICKMNKTTLSVTLILNGRKQIIDMTPSVYDPTIASLYKFTNWSLINEDGSGTIVEDGDEFQVSDSAKIVASFMPIASPDTSSVSVAFNKDVSVTNPPSGWNYDAATNSYTNSNVASHTTYGDLKGQWNSATYSVEGYGPVKVLGWYNKLLVMDILGSGDILMPLNLVKDKEEVYGAFNSLVPKFGYTATVEAGSHTTVSHTGDIDVPFDQNGTVVSVDENNSIYLASPSVTKPAIKDEGSSLDYDTSVQIDATGTDGYEVAYWNVYLKDEANPVQVTKNSSTTISGVITKITPASSNSNVTVNVALGNGIVNEGWTPDNWTKLDDHTYTSQVSGGTTFEMVLRAWNMEDKRLSYPGYMLQSWELPTGKEMTSLVEDNNTIVASWAEAITVPLYSKYPKLINFSDSQTQFAFENLQNISIKWRGTSDWIVLTMYDGSEKAYQMGSSDHACAYELNIYYHDTNANLCQAHVTETTDFLSAVGAVTVQDVASDFVRFDLDSYLYDYYRQNGSNIYSNGYPISKTNDLVDSSCQGTALVYNGETECAHFYVDMQNKLHIEDPVTGFSEIYYVDNPGEGNTVNWAYLSSEITPSAEVWTNISSADVEHVFVASVVPEADILLAQNSNNEKAKEGAGDVPEVDPKVDPVDPDDPVDPVDPKIDPVLPPQEEGGEGAAAAVALTLPALAALGFRRRLRGKHVKITK